VPVLLAASVSLATTVWLPSAKPVGVKLQCPLASAVAVAAIGVPSTVKCTTALASPEPDSAGSEVILSVADVPLSSARLTVTIGAVTVPSTTISVPPKPSSCTETNTPCWKGAARV
jgi:hypothetical protein